MISKVLTGHTFKGSILYVLGKDKQAEILIAEGVRGHDKNKMIEDFQHQHQQHPEKKNGCLHATLSFPPGEKLTDEQLKTIAREYLKKMGMENTQYTVVKHSDTEHQHVHIIGNMIDNDGNVISDSWIGHRGKKTAQELTEKYKLRKANSKKLEHTHKEKMRGHDRNRYEIYEAIKKHLPGCHSLKELEEKLKKEGIEVLYKHKGKTNEVQGISFRKGKYTFKGSEVDKQHSYGNLEKTIERNKQQQTIDVKHKPSKRKTPRGPWHNDKTHEPQKIDDILQQLKNYATKSSISLVKPELSTPETAPDQEQDPKKKRKRRRISM